MRSVPIWLLVISFLALAGAVLACPAVVRSTTTIASWTVDEFQDPSAGTPVEVELEFVSLEAGTMIQFYDGSTWTSVTGNGTTSGTAVRFQSGSVTVVYRDGAGCEEEITYASAG